MAIPEGSSPSERRDYDEDRWDHPCVHDALAKADALVDREGVLNRRVGERKLSLVARLVLSAQRDDREYF